MSGLTKLISSAYLPEALMADFVITEDPEAFVKKASFGSANLFDYDALKPSAGHVGIHAVAIGDYEKYGFNRNGDGFEKEANEKYHHTFVDNGHVYEHHKNKDPEKKLGVIKASAYNEPMGRIELVIHADIEKAASHLDRYEKTGEVSFSMGAKVPGDICSVCNTYRKSANDPNQCDHVKYALAKLNDDGTFNGVFNRKPKFFDFSFVGRPADRIAWDLKKVASAIVDSVSLADEAGLTYTGPSLSKLALAKKLASAEDNFKRLADGGGLDIFDRMVCELSKAASVKPLPDDDLYELRKLEPSDAAYLMAKHSMVLDPESYLKYVFGKDEFGKLAEILPAIKEEIGAGFSACKADGTITKLCAETIYDVDTDKVNSPVSEVLDKTAGAIDFSSGMSDDNLESLAICAAIAGPVKLASVDKLTKKSADPLVKVLTEGYLSYKLAAAEAINELSGGLTDRQISVMAAQNFYN